MQPRIWTRTTCPTWRNGSPRPTPPTFSRLTAKISLGPTNGSYRLRFLSSAIRTYRIEACTDPANDLADPAPGHSGHRRGYLEPLVELPDAGARLRVGVEIAAHRDQSGGRSSTGRKLRRWAGQGPCRRMAARCSAVHSPCGARIRTPGAAGPVPA
ncbi:MAG: hypothetical protein U1G05_14635 [Kiritimatiellia bacterium]